MKRFLRIKNLIKFKNYNKMSELDYECRFGIKHWKDFTEKEYKIIYDEREKNKDLQIEEKEEYALLCRACEKPNR
jgi:hypothetical protein